MEDNSSHLAHLVQEVPDVGLGDSEIVTQGFMTFGHPAPP